MNLFGRLCLLTAAAATLALAGCGSVSGTTAAARSGRPARTAPRLCAAPGEVNSLTVSRDDAFPGNHLRFRFPSRVTTGRPQQARAVARAVCGLPRMPRGFLSCPVDLGVSYRLAFGASGRRFGVVMVEAGGCQRVSGAGPARWLARSPGFWAVLGRATGVPGPGAFGGCGGSTRFMCPESATP